MENLTTKITLHKMDNFFKKQKMPQIERFLSFWERKYLEVFENEH